MQRRTENTDQLVLGSLIEALRRQGIRVGIGHYTRLQKLLHSLPCDCPLLELKTLLCPILASNEKEQEIFYRVFDVYLGPSVSSPEDSADTQNSSEVDFEKRNAPNVKRRWKLQHTIFLLAGLVLVGAIGLSLRWVFFRSTVSRPKAVFVEKNENNRPSSNLAPEAIKAVQATVPLPQSPLSSPPAPKYQPNAKKKNKWPDILEVAAVLIPLICFACYEFYRRWRRKLILDRQRGKRPPHTYPIRVPSIAPKLYEPGDFYTAVRLLRQRQISKPIYLDTVSTVNATIRSLGFPTLRYKFSSKPLEYLILIDRVSYGDHQARLYAFLAGALEKEDVFLTTFFYHRDPRVCYHSVTEQAFYLQDIKQKYSDSRLILFSNGEGLLDPVTGMMCEWAPSLFGEWSHRAILTPLSPAQWGWSEYNLDTLFFILPATLEGLLELTSHFELNISPDLHRWGKDGPSLQCLIENHTIENLKRELGSEVFQWLCACAVYPELNWNLTLYLGSLPGMPDKLMSEDAISRLSGLAWFREGSIPDSWRWQLIKQLDPGIQSAIRTALIELLEQCTPPKDTFAFDAHQLNLSLQQWQLNLTRTAYKRLQKAVRSLPPSVVARDYVLLRYLESRPNSILENIIPKRFHKYFFRNGLSIYGLKTFAAFLIAAFIGVILLAGLETVIRYYDLRESQSAPSASPSVDEPSALFAKNEAGAGAKPGFVADVVDGELLSTGSSLGVQQSVVPIILPKLSDAEASAVQIENSTPAYLSSASTKSGIREIELSPDKDKPPPPPLPPIQKEETLGVVAGKSGSMGPFGPPRCARLSTASQSSAPVTVSIGPLQIPVGIIPRSAKSLGKKVFSGIRSMFPKKKEALYRNQRPSVALALEGNKKGGDGLITEVPGAVCAGDSVPLIAAASDPDGDLLLYSWTSTGGRIRGDGNATTFDTTGLMPGYYTITVEVNDGCGLVAFDSKTIRVAKCLPVVHCYNNDLDLSVASKLLARSGEIIYVSSTGVHGGRNYGNVKYEWAASSGTIRGAGLNAELDTTGVSQGAVIIISVLAISDMGGCAAKGETQVLITPKDSLQEKSDYKLSRLK
ncbi:MAG: PKD domain-containing protein [Blastocatellia bacterium]|nr:PKD domain-containing protein [Blastocatellia bacterium]